MIDKVNNFLNSPRGFLISFVIIFIAVTSSVNLYDNFNAPPTGIHLWRQTDGISQIVHYEENGLNFFDHGIAYNQLENGGKAVAEFPFPYHLSAIINVAFGHQIWHIKLVWLTFLFFGLFYLSKLITKHTSLPITSILVAHSFFISKVFNAYVINFIPDPIALSSSFIGLYFWHKYLKKPSRKSIITAIIFVTLAGLIKPFYLIPVLSLVPFFGIQFIRKKYSIKDLISRSSPILISLIFVFIWFSWVNYYNNTLYPNTFFLTNFLPYFSLNDREVSGVIKNVKELWVWEYFYFSLDRLLIGLSLTVLVSTILLKKHYYLALTYFVSGIGVLLFIILMFRQFQNHDYYILPILFLIPFSLAIILGLINLKHQFILQVLSLIVFSVILYKSNKMESIRYTDWMNEIQSSQPYIKLAERFSDYGINQNDTILVLEDYSPQKSLYFLNRKGYTSYNVENQKAEEIIKQGVSYVISPNDSIDRALEYPLFFINEDFKIHKIK